MPPRRARALDELSDITRKHTTATVVDSGAGKLLFSEYGARLLGMFPDRTLPNVLWTHEELDAHMAKGSWLVGGERLWLSPERNYYYENPRDFEVHRVPAGLDPGNYHTTGELTFENEFSVLDSLRNETYDNCSARRQFVTIDDPYASGLDFTGVRIDDTMKVAAPGLEIAAWSLAMVFNRGPGKPGTALFPVTGAATILGYFWPIPPDRADVRDGYARFKIDGDAEYKLGLLPTDMDFDNPCKAVYVSPYPDGDRWFCILKRSNDMPGTVEECVDQPKAELGGARGATQAFNCGPDTGEGWDFGEIELQLLKGITQGDATVSHAVHELIAYAGSKDEILELARNALGSTSPPVLF